MRNAPIQKVIAALATALVIYVLSQVGIEFDEAQVQEAVQGAVPLIVAYLWPDPRVVGSAGRREA